MAAAVAAVASAMPTAMGLTGGIALATQPVVTLYDAGGNVATGNSYDVTLTTSTTIDGSSRKKLQQRLEAEYQIIEIVLDASVNYGAKRRRGLQKELLVDGGGVCKSLSSKTHVNTNC